MERVRDQAVAAGGAAAPIASGGAATPVASGGAAPPRVEDGALAEYAVLLDAVVAAGSTHRWLLLDGFLHSADCASLWLFDPKKLGERAGSAIQVEQLLDDEPYIILVNSGVEIFLFEKIAPEKLLALNEHLGASLDLPPQLDYAARPQVRFVYAERIQTVAETTSQRPRSGGRTREVRKRTDASLPIAKDYAGIAAMLESLRPALAALARNTEALRRTIADGLK
ncbi:MAG: hypothetical protein GEV05_13220 [Betaproteobacteria bacterium]|nr:hypothetical protein [Betaproteobacteria bacterium]